MFPVLIDLGTWNLPFIGETPVFLPTYGFLFAISVVAGWSWFARRGRTLGVDPEVQFNLAFYSVLGGLLGAKFLLILLDWRFYFENPRLILGTLRSAGVLVGGVVAGAFVFVYFCRRHKLPTWKLADALAAPLVLAQGIGRLGCWAAGCCWGHATDANHPLAVIFTDPRAGAQTGVPLHTPIVATQLVQMASDLSIAIVVTILWRRRPEPAGTVFWTYVLLYSVGRGMIEFWRGDVNRGLWFGETVSTSQLFAIAGFVAASAILLLGRLNRRPAPA
jgi:phosphatidylglycerol:prolipoprotein diacylglycerol transferase